MADPVRNVARYACHGSTSPPTSTASIPPTTTTLTICVAIITYLRGKRSDRLPATSPSRNIGAIRKTPTSATCDGESVSSSTSHDRTAISIMRFIYQSHPAIQRRRKTGLRSERNVRKREVASVSSSASVNGEVLLKRCSS